MVQRILLTIICVLTLSIFGVYGQHTLSSIPNPKHNGAEFYTSNPDGVLSSYVVNELNTISIHIDSMSKAEYVVVVVNDFQGEDEFDFALELFNQWGIGKKESNNGLLLFIAKDRKKYRFISGYGMESIFPDAYLKRVGEKYLVPNFRNEDYNEGVLQASQFIENILTSSNTIKELEALMPEATPFWSWRSVALKNSLLIILFFGALYILVHIISSNILKPLRVKPKPIAPIFWGMGCMVLLMFLSVFIFAFVFKNIEQVYRKENIPYFIFVLMALILAMKITDGRTNIEKSFKDEEDKQNAIKRFTGWLFIPMLLTPLAWIDLAMISRNLKRNSGRFTPPDDSGDWVRINRSSKKDVKDFLSQGQKKEETLKSRKYEIWRNMKSGKTVTIPWEIEKTYAECPQCHYFTLDTRYKKVLEKATYSSSGEGERFDKCTNCTYILSKGKFIIPKKVKESSSGSGSSSGGGSSSRSSGGSSFGGGRSGGGGAGGSW